MAIIYGRRMIELPHLDWVSEGGMPCCICCGPRGKLRQRERVWFMRRLWRELFGDPEYECVNCGGNGSTHGPNCPGGGSVMPPETEE